MDRSGLIDQLVLNHKVFAEKINSLIECEFLYHAPEKWSAGQQLLHVYKSLKPLAKALNLPTTVLKLTFGVAKDPSKTYDEIVGHYQAKLKEGHGAPKEFTPTQVNFEKRDSLIKKIEEQIESIRNSIVKLDEQKLDSLQLPHPLLGKLTIREMIYFTSYHVMHHQDLMEKYLQGYDSALGDD